MRIFLIPIFLVVVSLRFKYGDYIAAAVFILAASTDGLDGYIARKKKLVTKLGKLMDPLADKLLITAALVSLVELNRLPGWVAVIIIGREFAITGLRALAAAEGNIIAASNLGKIKTVTQIVAVVALFLAPKIVASNTILGQYLPIYLGYLAMGVAVFFTIWSGLEYVSRCWPVIKRGGY